MLNPHTLPLVPYPGLAPELAVRSAMGGWEPYAQPVPADRLLPFVLTRAISDSNGRWLNCARIEHADTGALLTTLIPVGPSAAPTAPLTLLLRKYADPAAGVEHFVYMGGAIPGLALPCGVPVRLVLDNVYQSPRLAGMLDSARYLLLEWWDNGPANGVPYGTGFRQRLYVENGALRHEEPTKQKETTKRADGSDDRLDALTLINNASVALPPLPAYLAQAVNGMEATAHFEADGEAWQVSEVKQAAAGPDGGRYSLSVSVKQRQALKFKASCPAPALALTAYDPADAAHPWRCGEVSDTAPDWQTIGRSCAEDVNGDNSGLVNLSQRNVNPQSPTVNTTRTLPNAEGPNLVLCPLPVYFLTRRPSTATATRNNCPAGQAGSVETFVVATGAFRSRVSSAAAEAEADLHATAEAQAYANRVGTCSVAGTGGTVTWRPVYLANGCFACQMVNANDATDVRDATPQEAADYRVNSVFYQGVTSSCASCF